MGGPADHRSLKRNWLVFSGGLASPPQSPLRPVAPGGGDGIRGTQGRGSLEMWQNVSKISPLFCGKIFEIFCHGLPAGGRQLFRTSTIFLPLLTPAFRQTLVYDNRRCVRFYGFRKSKQVLMLGPSPPRRARRRYPRGRRSARLPEGQGGVTSEADARHVRHVRHGLD